MTELHENGDVTVGASTALAAGNAPKSSTALTSSKKKEPPPERSRTVLIRRLVIASFWAVVVFLGLPIWWRTTTIYRANLPLIEMLNWAEGKACRPVFPLQILIEPGAISEQESQYLLRTTQHALDDLNDFSAHHLRLQLSSPSNLSNNGSKAREQDEKALVIRLLPGASNEAVLRPYEPVLDVYYMPNQLQTSSSTSNTLATFLSHQLREIFSEEQAMIAYLLSTSSSPLERSPKALASDVSEKLAKRSSRSFPYSRMYHLTFSMFTASATPSSWNIETALEEDLKPLLRSLSALSSFTIDTQVQLYAMPGIHGQQLKRDELSGFINAAEWPLSPSIGGAPTINFILYIGDMEVEGGGKSWLIPQWGGVVIASSADDLRPAMLTFSKQLLALLGAPDEGSLPLRLSTLIRVRSAELMLKASGTLGSLARLTLALPSISIPQTVAAGVDTSIKHLQSTCSGLGSKQGLASAQVAEEAAEKAFFEKSMVGQVYFPDEHKIAVYLPLLGPIGVPLIMGILKEVKNYRARAMKCK